MLLLQKDRTYGKRLPPRTRRIVETEEGRPGKVCLYHDQGAHKGAERKFYKDGDGGQRRGGFLKQRTGSTSVSPSLSIEHVQVAQIKKNTMTVDILILGESLGQKKIVETTTLLDTGAAGKFINQNFIQNQKIETKELKYPIEVFNVDGTPNKWGTIMKYTQLDLTINGQMWTHNLLVTGLGKQKIILEYLWFKQTNPDINWKECTLTWRTKQDERKPTPKPTIKNEIDPEDWKNYTVNLIEELDNKQIGNAVLLSYIEEAKSKVWINAKTGIAMELAIKENEKKADLLVEKLIPEDIHNFLDVFDNNKANWFPESNVWDHKIDMKEGFEPKSFKNYNLTLEEQKKLDKFLDENLEKGYIRLSQSPQASPFFFVKKKDGRLGPCQDYWYLNDWTVKDAYPLPPISEIIDKLKGAKYFSKFDVQWGYNNVWIPSGDEWKAAFKTNWGLYKPTVMFFGMCNSLATFQAMMDKIFKKEIEENLIIVYMDDILAFSKTIDGLKEIEQIILEKAWEYNLYFKAKKCKFRKPKIEYLGPVVEEGKLAMDPAKLKGILDWPAPKTVKEVRSFIGFGKFYRCFVKGFSHLAHPLHDLLKKEKESVWSEECQESFDQLKKWFTEEPVLMMPDYSKPSQIQVDSLLFATGGILTQMNINGDRHPCAYLSKSLTKEQRNYDTGDRELLAIVQALKG
jgi:RNase H-like domain found in reverse transcriptase/Reverse transcriptase (RNA-dependent DNA polymerase)/Retroviral aspartyl protease